MNDYNIIKKIQEENSFLKEQNEAYLNMLNQYELFNFYTSKISSLKTKEEVCFLIIEALEVFFVKKNERNSSAVFVLEDDSFEFSCKVADEEKEGFEKEFFKQAEAGVIAWIISNKKSIIVSPLNSTEYISCMLVPMCSGDNMIGITIVYFNMAITAFERENLKVIDFLCSQAGIFIENLVFSRKKIEQNKKLELANQILKKEQKRADIANKAKSDFLANMSHEIRTPMTCIMGYAEMLQESAHYSEKESKHINAIYTSSRVLMALINDILDISKIEAGAILLESIPFNMKYLISSVIDILNHKIQKKNLSLICDLDKNIPYAVKGDPTRIRQIFLNIIGNAIKFTEKGSVTIRGGVTGVNDNKISFAFVVEDTGIGIANDKKEEIFESFSQVEASISRQYGGTGLGLSITKALVHILGGSISVESSLGRGSSFSFSFTLDMSKEAANEDYTSRYMMQSELKNKKVCIIDSNMGFCKTLKECCDSVGMKNIGIFSCSGEAVAFMKEKKSLIPDIILADIHLTDNNDADIALFCKENFPDSNIKLVAVSSYAFPGAARKSKEMGFDAYLAKPIEKDDLLNIICLVLGEDGASEKYIITRHTTQELGINQAKKAKRRRRILLAEDNEAIREYIHEFLDLLYCDVSFAADGQIAVDMVRENDYDLVLMDINMPNMDGVTAATMIRKEISAVLPIVALTAAATVEAKDAVLKAGMNDFITKPVSQKKLKAAIDKWALIN